MWCKNISNYVTLSEEYSQILLFLDKMYKLLTTYNCFKLSYVINPPLLAQLNNINYLSRIH